MNLKNLFTDEDAVSPVIGVILMVAITVILAAVIGTFVLGLGDQVQNNAPQASFNFDYDGSASGTGPDLSGAESVDGELTITHDGGDTIPAARLEVKANNGQSTAATNVFSGTDISAGSSGIVQIDAGTTIRVTWTGDGGDNTATIGQFSGPDA